MLIRIPPEKQREFLLSAQLFLPEGAGRPSRILYLRDMDDASRICWLTDWETRAPLSAFIGSEGFRALRGAVRVLGSLEEVEIQARCDVDSEIEGSIPKQKKTNKKEVDR